MAQRWRATILTQSNVLQNVEFETPGSWRQDAIAQVKSMYGAKEVKFCNPISSSSNSNSWSSNISSDDDDASWFWILAFGALIAVYVFRYVIAIAVVAFICYYLYKWLFK